MIKSNTCLEVLSLNDNNLRSSSLTILQALKGISSLKQLNLFGNDIPETVDEELANVVKNNNSLEVLNLGKNNLQASAVIKRLMGLSTLQHLYLSNNNLSKEAVLDLADVFNNNSCLKSLSLVGNNLQSAVRVMKALKGITNLKRLYLTFVKMCEEVAKELVDVIKNNALLEELDLSFYNIKSSTVAKILQALSEISNLEVLKLSGIRMLNEVVEAIVCAIKSNFHLQELSLGNNNLGSSAVVILQALKRNSNLKKLNLSNNNLSGEVVNDLSSVIKNSLYLNELDLGNNKIQSSAIVILQALQSCSNLVKLNLSCINLCGEVVEDLARVIMKNCLLEQLYLHGNELQPFAGSVFQALKYITSLKVLSLIGSDISDKEAHFLADVLQCNPYLSELQLFNSNVQQSTAVILRALTKISNLKVLTLDGTNISRGLCCTLVDVINQNTSISAFSLSNSDLQSSAKVILKALKRIKTLKKLNLACSNLPEIVANDLADVIKANTCLEELYLGYNNLRLSVAFILQALQETSCLKVLSLDGSIMLGKVASDLASVIRSNTQLTVLSLSANGFYSSAVVILQALKQISHLKVLNLDHNYFLGKLAEDVADVIKCNPYLEVICLHSNNLKSHAKPVLKALELLPSLTLLDLGNNDMSSATLNNLSLAIDSKNLVSLHIGGNDLQNGFTATESPVVSGILFVTDNNFTINGVSGLKAIIAKNITLTELWVGNNILRSGLFDITKECVKLKNLEVLELRISQ